MLEKWAQQMPEKGEVALGTSNRGRAFGMAFWKKAVLAGTSSMAGRCGGSDKGWKVESLREGLSLGDCVSP